MSIFVVYSFPVVTYNRSLHCSLCVFSLQKMTSFTLLVLFDYLHVYTYADKTRYTNEWIVEVNGGPEFADEIAARIADRHGFRNLGKVLK